MMSEQVAGNDAGDASSFDAIVIGAGFGGLRMLYELRTLGLSARVIETAGDVGGTWYWNRYPNARTDSESWVYAFSFSRELQEVWDWRERYPSQAETLDYLRYVADRFDMRKDIELNTTVRSAIYDEDRSVWTVITDPGQTYSCRYLIPAVGLLSAPYVPDFPGLDTFAGACYVTGLWPQEGVDYAGKRVAVIGTGSTAIQVIPAVAKTAAHLTVFQRTPNYVIPGRNYTMTEDERREVRANYGAVWEKARNHFFGMAMTDPGRKMADVSPEEQQRILERGWEAGGFHFVFETFDDILVDEKANATVAEFIRNRIRTIVEDPETAEVLCPKDYTFGGKRPALGHFYYETYNRDNVTLVDIRDNPITEITPRGVRTGTDEYECDIIILATGFDAGTGTLNKIDIRGRQGTSLREKWEAGPRTYLGICIDDFPNLFMISGPQSPFANAPVVIDGIVEWIGAALQHLLDNDLAAMEPTPDAVEQWCAHMDDLINSTLLTKGRNSWFLGANIPGKPQVVLFYFGGAGTYRDECREVADRGYDGFVLTKESARAL